MQAIETARTEDLMAIWRATGGAMATVGRTDDEAGDDGLAASGPTPVTGGCWIDDGLAATALTRAAGCLIDDGLAAGGHSGAACWIDDGLAASGPTAEVAPACGFVDDGLAATAPTRAGGCY